MVDVAVSLMVEMTENPQGSNKLAASIATLKAANCRFDEIAKSLLLIASMGDLVTLFVKCEEEADNSCLFDRLRWSDQVTEEDIEGPSDDDEDEKPVVITKRVEEVEAVFDPANPKLRQLPGMDEAAKIAHLIDLYIVQIAGSCVRTGEASAGALLKLSLAFEMEAELQRSLTLNPPPQLTLLLSLLRVVIFVLETLPKAYYYDVFKDAVQQSQGDSAAERRPIF